jgi:2-oxoglutarate ferredoxin oxidoreductase subunit beta
LIAEAVQHPGFSFVEVLSPCVTFRPEQRDWRKMVRPASVEATTDRSRAARRLVTDDGFNLGLLFKADRAPYAPDIESQGLEPADFEGEFAA